MNKILFGTFLAALLFQSCITIKESTFNDGTQKVIEVDNYKLSSTGEVYMNFLGIIKADFVPSSFKIEFDSIIVYLDPIVINESQNADFIFITHNHLDHFSKKDIEQLAKSETLIIGPKTVTKKLKKYNCKTAMVGDVFEIGKIKYQVVEAYNIQSNIHKKGNKHLGFVITYKDVSVYTAGDTDHIPEMAELENITLALLPIGEGKTAMNPNSAADAANIIKPQIVIPCHYEIGNNSEQTFMNLVDESIQVILLR
jgi:L-ascorbate metabolism protein UlaG (beta-lactamase superfamily)